MERLIKSFAEIIVSTSHQSVLIKYILESSDIFDIKTLTLEEEEFPSGKMFHHNKSYVSSLKANAYTPYVFHMCWTSNSDDKVKFFKELHMWYLDQSDKCFYKTK